MPGLLPCPGPRGEGCPDDASTLGGRLCRTCAAPPAPEQKPKKRRATGIEALIEGATTEAVQAERQARWTGRRR